MLTVLSGGGTDNVCAKQIVVYALTISRGVNMHREVMITYKWNIACSYEGI